MTRRSLLMSWLPLAASLPLYSRPFSSSSANSQVSPGKTGGSDDLLYSNQPNPPAVQEVLSGKRTAANAAWWGFNAEDSTATLQAAFDSRAKTVLIPFMGEPWIVRPLKLRGDQKVIFEPGVLILAKKGEFLGKGDSLLTAEGISNLVLWGYGATLRMRKKDYQHPPYEKAEWRMGVGIRGCKNVRIEGLRSESSGGDGFYVDGGGSRLWSEDIVIRHCVSDDNHRQGLSVISAVNLLVEDCTFSNTSGTAPESGIDIEPDSAKQKLVNCVVRNCLFENNRGNQMAVYLRQFSKQTAPVSIRFENCLARMTPSSTIGPGGQCNGYAAMSIGAVKDDGPQGLIEFRNCTSENSCKEGIRIYDKSARNALVRLVNCSWADAWMGGPGDHSALEVPVLVQLRRPFLTQDYGGVDFVNCHVYDTVDRPALAAEVQKGNYSVRDLRGKIAVKNPFGARVSLGPNPGNISLKVIDTGK
jgi:Right handed beta helix region